MENKGHENEMLKCQFLEQLRQKITISETKGKDKGSIKYENYILLHSGSEKDPPPVQEFYCQC